MRIQNRVVHYALFLATMQHIQHYQNRRLFLSIKPEKLEEICDTIISCISKAIIPNYYVLWFRNNNGYRIAIVDNSPENTPFHTISIINLDSHQHIDTLDLLNHFNKFKFVPHDSAVAELMHQIKNSCADEEILGSAVFTLVNAKECTSPAHVESLKEAGVPLYGFHEMDEIPFLMGDEHNYPHDLIMYDADFVPAGSTNITTIVLDLTDYQISALNDLLDLTDTNIHGEIAEKFSFAISNPIAVRPA